MYWLTSEQLELLIKKLGEEFQSKVEVAPSL